MLTTRQEKLRDDVAKWVEEYGGTREAMMPVLHNIQSRYRHVSEYAMQVVADALGIHPAEVYGVVTFYTFFKSEPQGQFVIRLCRTLSCDFARKDRVARQLENDLGIKFGETTPDGKFTLEYASCIGMCDQGPAMLVNEKVYTHVTPERVHDILEACRQTFGLHALAKKEEH